MAVLNVSFSFALKSMLSQSSHFNIDDCAVARGKNLETSATIAIQLEHAKDAATQQT